MSLISIPQEELADNTIPLGQSDSAPFVAIGDESIYGDILVYAYVIVPRIAIVQIERELLGLKLKFGIPKEKELHCRYLCSPSGRSQGGFEFLNRESVEDLLIEVFNVMQKNNTVIRAGYSTYSHHKGRFAKVLRMNDISGKNPKTVDVHTLKSGEIDPKVILGSISHFIWARSLSGYEPSAVECEILVNAEVSAVKFLGEKSRPAQEFCEGFLDINCPPGRVYRIQPKAVIYAENFMVQLSDIAAYTVSHAFSPNPDCGLYRNLLRYCIDAQCTPFNMSYAPSIADDY